MGDELRVPDVLAVLRDLVLQVPSGRVTTYRALAEALGDPGATPFVAEWLMSLEAADLPAHRVVHASGAVGRTWGRAQEETAQRLIAEGVRVEGGQVVPLTRYFFWDFRTERPLAMLQAEQEEIGRRVALAPLPEVRTVGAVDIAYRGDEAVAAYVLGELGGDVVDYVVARMPVRFPYIPTYLSYRELPAYRAAVAEAERAGLAADVLLVDGNGVLHPRRAGVAAYLGVLLDRPTVGVAKRRLCGDVNTVGMAIGEWRPVALGEDTVGAAIRTDRNRTLFVSPGHRADLAGAVELVQALTRQTALPWPLMWAHDLAAETAAG
ncbi:endonuclease V [Candidatus Bipolaricaulota bacterium]|nr:endonuclease V [Candidatus Bipolaricaulota bacterium]